MSVKTERETQAVKIRDVYAYLKARMGTWVPALEIAGTIHSLAVSTKLSQARELAKVDDCEILWNRDARNSCYMLRPIRLGRDAADQVASPWNQDRPFGEDFKLIP